MLIALTRDISPNFNQCELTHLDRTPIDVALARLNIISIRPRCVS